MKLNRIYLSLMMFIIMLTLTATGTEAKWWIFGQSEDAVSIQYLFLNKASFDETGSKITIYREMLPDGKITITGKANAGQGKVGSARVSLDGKNNWNDANLSENGAFEYSFRPEMGKTYAIYIEVSDTTGKTNDVKATYRQLTVSDRNVMSIIKEVLNKLIDAYEKHDAKTFMSMVSEDFAGEATNLDRAIRKDFSSFDNIDLNFTLNNITSDTKGISVSLSYNRHLTSTKSGQSLKDKGSTEFVFKMSEKAVKVYSMKNPLIFGVTGAPNVATGTVQSTTSGPVIIADSTGKAAEVPAQVYSELVNDSSLRITNNTDGSSTVKSSSETIVVDQSGTQTGGGALASDTVEKGSRIITLPPAKEFSFVDGAVVGANAGDFAITGGIPPGGIAVGALHPGVTYCDLGVKSLSSVNEAPSSGYSAPAPPVQFVVGHTYAFKLTSGKYGLMEVTTVTIGPLKMYFSYKYQTNGTRQFLP